MWRVARDEPQRKRRMGRRVGRDPETANQPCSCSRGTACTPRQTATDWMVAHATPRRVNGWRGNVLAECLLYHYLFGLALHHGPSPGKDAAMDLSPQGAFELVQQSDP